MTTAPDVLQPRVTAAFAAEYERLAHEVQATEADIAAAGDLFEPLLDRVTRVAADVADEEDQRESRGPDPEAITAEPDAGAGTVGIPRRL